jgi:hypothetical protein
MGHAMADLQEIQGKLDAVKTTMNENIQFALRNTEKIEDVQVKSERLMDSSHTFKARATALKRQYGATILCVAACILISVVFLVIGLK